MDHSQPLQYKLIQLISLSFYTENINQELYQNILLEVYVPFHSFPILSLFSVYMLT